MFLLIKRTPKIHKPLVNYSPLGGAMVEITFLATGCDLTVQLQYRFSMHGLRKVDLFALPKCRTNVGKAAPLYRLYNTYNGSYADTDIFLPLHTFKDHVMQ